MEPERGQPETEPLAPPGDLRPAQMGVLLDHRLTLGHLGVSLIDLVQRGLLGAERVSGPDDPGDDPYAYDPYDTNSPDGLDWILTDRRGPATPQPGYDYESFLLDSLFAGPSPLRLSELTADTVRGLDQVRNALLDDMRQWHWLSSVGGDTPDIADHGRDARRKIWAFRHELTDRFRAGQNVSGLAQYVALFDLAPEPDPLVTAWLAACDHFRDPQFTAPDRPVFDEPVQVFYLNWVSPPGYRSGGWLHHHEDTGLAAWAAGVEEHHPDEPSRLVRWLRAAWLASGRGGGGWRRRG